MIDKGKGNMEIRLETIEMDASIQCRAVIDTATVGEYAERMTEGDVFPPVVLFGTAGKSWIGDGWHRVLAARQIGIVGIEADLRAGGRKEALTHALGANAANGLRRSNADKRRCVEIALKEFGKLSSRAIAELCGVDHKTVEAARGLGKFPNEESRTTSDGRQYPATRKPSIFAPDAPCTDPLPDSGEEDTDAPDVTTGGKVAEHADAPRKKQYKGSTRDSIRFREIFREIGNLIDETIELNIPNSDRSYVITELEKTKCNIAKAIDKIRRMK